MMQQPDKQWQLDYYALVLREQSPAIWAVKRETGWTLPQVTLQHHIRWMRTVEVMAALEGQLSTPLAFLYEPYAHDDDARASRTSALVFSVIGESEPSGSGAWLTQAEAVAIEAPAAIQQCVQICLAEMVSGDVPALRAPWARPGWHTQMLTWVDATLDALDFPRQGRVELVKSWGLSHVLRIPTSAPALGGNVFFKAVSAQPLFVNEPVMMDRLAQIFPRNIPQPLAVQPEQRWMLLPDVGEVLGWDTSVENKRDVLTAFGRLQIEAAERVEALLEVGCIDRRLPVLAEQIEPLLAHPAIAAALTEEELAQLHSLEERLKADCERLTEYNIPQTLGHGDFHGGNVTQHDGDYMIIDWTDACIMHPFLDMITIHQHKEQSEQERLWEHYVSLWSGFESRQRLMEALTLARPLMCLHQAISYQFLLDNLEPWAREDLAWGPPYWLRSLLEFL